MKSFEKIKYSFIYILISIEKKISNTIINYQAIYYKKLYKEKFSYEFLPRLGKNFYLDLQQKSSIKFKHHFVARGGLSIVGRNEGQIEIGNNVFFNMGCSISCFENVKIGDHVMFGENVKVYDHNHEYRNQNELIALQGYTVAPVNIGNNCWIGTNVVILKGVTIGDNVVIAAGAVVSKSVASNQLIISKQQTINKTLNNE